MKNNFEIYNDKNNILISKLSLIKFLITYLFLGSTIYFSLNPNYILKGKSYENKINKKLSSEINKTFKENNKVNINFIESKLNMLKSNENNIDYKSVIHIGFTLDSRYILETMLTITSIMTSQLKTTKIVFHFGVINDFNGIHMLKMYQLKSKINNSTEFNFYYLKGAMEKMKNFHPKGEACPGKFELPQLLPDDVEKIIIFDAGDLLVFRDLTELYNYDMKDNWAVGVPEPWCIRAFVAKYNKKKYLNIGSILLNVKELKKNNFWDSYTKNRNLKLGGAVDQTLFNIVVPDDKIGYFPFRFGGYSILCSDESTDKFNFVDFGFKNWLKSSLADSLPENPMTEINITAHFYSPLYIHVMCGEGKWSLGRGTSIYRYLVKYFIKLAGIWEELCQKKPGYCI